jgi:hypothetical protein
MKTRPDDAPRPAHDFIPQISCTAPACNISQINSANSTGLLKSLKPIETAAKYHTATRKTSYQCGRRRSAHTTRLPTTTPTYHIAKLIYHGKTLIQAVIHGYTAHSGIQPIWFNGIRRARLYITCHTCRTLHPKFAYIIHKSMLSVCIHRYLYLYVGLDSNL